MNHKWFILSFILLFIVGYECAVSANLFLTVPMHYPLFINVVFIGFKGDGPFQYKLRDEQLLSALRHALPYHTPHSLSSHSPLISVAGDIQKYEGYLRNALKKRGDENSIQFKADIASVESFFENLNPPDNLGNYTIYFVHPNKEQLVGRFQQMEYSYSLNGWGNAQSWVGSGRYMVIDLTAGPVRYGKMTGEADGGSVVDYESFPRIIEYFMPDGYQGTSLQGASPIEIEAQISSLVVSAVQHIFASDISSEHIPTAEKILVPIIVLRNHNDFNPFDDGINMENVRHEVLRMALPGQTIQIISANHYMHEHSHISIALSKSMKTDTEIDFNQLGQYRPHYRPYVDSKQFASQMREVSDILGQGLLGNSMNTNDLKSIYFNENLPPSKGTVGPKRSLGTRVLPVYVLSLARYDSKLLLDKYHQVASFNDMVVVLQTGSENTSVPFFSNSKPISINAKEATKSIIAGIATSLGSITSPSTRFSELHNKQQDEYLWAQGQHPFGHFTNSTRLSQILVDDVTKNAILAKLHNSMFNLRASLESVNKFAKSYFLDPMDTNGNTVMQLSLVARIKAGIDNFDTQFYQVADMLNTFKIKEAFTFSGALEVGTAKFLDYTLKEIEIAENDLICCIVS